MSASTAPACVPFEEDLDLLLLPRCSGGVWSMRRDLLCSGDLWVSLSLVLASVTKCSALTNPTNQTHHSRKNQSIPTPRRLVQPLSELTLGHASCLAFTTMNTNATEHYNESSEFAPSPSFTDFPNHGAHETIDTPHITSPPEPRRPQPRLPAFFPFPRGEGCMLLLPQGRFAVVRGGLREGAVIDLCGGFACLSVCLFFWEIMGLSFFAGGCRI